MGIREDVSVSPSLSPPPPVTACQAFFLIEMQGWPLRPSAEPSAPEGTFPSFPPSSQGCLWSYSSASAFHNSSKADASSLSGDGDVRRMARGPQAGVGRFPAISQASSPSLSPAGLCLRLGLRHGAGMGKGRGWGGRALGYADPIGMPNWDAGKLPAVCTLQPSPHVGSRDPTLSAEGLHQRPVWPWCSHPREGEQPHGRWQKGREGEKGKVGMGGLFLPKSPPALGALGEPHSCLEHCSGLGMIRDRVSRTSPPRLPRAAVWVPLLSRPRCGAGGRSGSSQLAVCGRAAGSRCVFYP